MGEIFRLTHDPLTPKEEPNMIDVPGLDEHIAQFPVYEYRIISTDALPVDAKAVPFLTSAPLPSDPRQTLQPGGQLNSNPLLYHNR